MTIAIAIKVNDGLVIATDSASTLVSQTGDVITVHNNANKIVNICKGIPVGVMMWGLSNIGQSSVPTLLKDFRKKLAGDDLTDTTFKIDPQNYRVLDIANNLKEFIKVKYETQFQTPTPNTFMGLAVCGYSSSETLSEIHELSFSDQGVPSPSEPLPKNMGGWIARGEPELIFRIMYGVSPQIGNVFSAWGIATNEHQARFDQIMQQLSANLIFDPMPIKDVIDIADWLVQSTIMFSRYTPGAATVGGPVEIAVITKHEGFKWVKRKHYFDVSLNHPRRGQYEDGWIKQPNGGDR